MAIVDTAGYGIDINDREIDIHTTIDLFDDKPKAHRAFNFVGNISIYRAKLNNKPVEVWIVFTWPKSQWEILIQDDKEKELFSATAKSYNDAVSLVWDKFGVKI